MAHTVLYYAFLLALPFAAVGALILAYLSLLYAWRFGSPVSGFSLLAHIPNTKRNRFLLSLGLWCIAPFLAVAGLLQFTVEKDVLQLFGWLVAAGAMVLFSFAPIGNSLRSWTPRNGRQRLYRLLTGLIGLAVGIAWIVYVMSSAYQSQ